VHSFEWSAGAGAGTTAAFALEKAIAPLALVDQLPEQNRNLKISNAAWRKWQPDCISQYLDFQRIMVRLALA